LGAISSSTLTFIVFVFSVLLLVVQIASANLSPRVIAIAVKSYPAKTALAMFLFTYIYATGVLGRIENTVPQLEVLLTISFCLVSLPAFLYLIDYVGEGLRPASGVARVANDGYYVIARMYPPAHGIKRCDDGWAHRSGGRTATRDPSCGAFRRVPRL